MTNRVQWGGRAILCSRPGVLTRGAASPLSWAARALSRGDVSDGAFPRGIVVGQMSVLGVMLGVMLDGMGFFDARAGGDHKQRE